MPTTTQSAQNLLDHALEAINRRDAEPLIDAYATDDVVLIGTERDHWHEQTDAIAAALRADAAGDCRLDWKLRPVELDADAALLVGELSFVLPDGAIFVTRATYVLRREHEAWRIAHSHLSMPTDS